MNVSIYNNTLDNKEWSKQIIGASKLKMDIHSAANAGDLSALQDAIRKGVDGVNSVKVSWFVGM